MLDQQHTYSRAISPSLSSLPRWACHELTHCSTRLALSRVRYLAKVERVYIMYVEHGVVRYLQSCHKLRRLKELCIKIDSINSGSIRMVNYFISLASNFPGIHPLDVVNHHGNSLTTVLCEHLNTSNDFQCLEQLLQTGKFNLDHPCIEQKANCFTCQLLTATWKWWKKTYWIGSWSECWRWIWKDYIVHCLTTMQ